MASDRQSSDEYIDSILERLNSRDQSEEAINARLRKTAQSAEPYPYDHILMRTLDGDRTAEEMARIRATSARMVLERSGIPVDVDNEED